MRKTLLEIVQSILNELDSDEANSINDTVEAAQVAAIVRDCFLELTSNRNWPHQKKIMQLDAAGSTSKPNYFKLPSGTKELTLFKYNVAKVGDTKITYRDIKYLYPDEFLDIINQRNSDLPTVQTVSDYSGVNLLIYNDRAPQYWTSFDDEYLICDAYDSAVETTLKKAKSQAILYKQCEWEHTDDYIPDLPDEAFSLLEEEAKSTAFLALKQMANQKAEQKAGRQNRWLARKAWKAKGGIRYPSYGRK
ncbi:MAG TPA: hypothetical protein VFM18_22030 [Methanosarcina sp.]|nr:hypothetical protein [Methanosarcina sp.]